METLNWDKIIPARGDQYSNRSRPEFPPAATGSQDSGSIIAIFFVTI